MNVRHVQGGGIYSETFFSPTCHQGKWRMIQTIHDPIQRSWIRTSNQHTLYCRLMYGLFYYIWLIQLRELWKSTLFSTVKALKPDLSLDRQLADVFQDSQEAFIFPHAALTLTRSANWAENRDKKKWKKVFVLELFSSECFMWHTSERSPFIMSWFTPRWEKQLASQRGQLEGGRFCHKYHRFGESKGVTQTDKTQRIKNNVTFQRDYCDSQTLFFPLRKNILYIPQLLSKQA